MKNKLAVLMGMGALVALLLGCKGRTTTEQALSKASQGISVQAHNTFTLPVVPAYLAGDEAKQRYLAEHYWDNLRFDDRQLMADRELFEKHFVNYLFLVAIQDMTAANQCITRLMQQLLNQRDWLLLFLKTAEFYLFDITSPMVNEAMYVPFVQTALTSSLLTEMERVVYTDQFEVASKNNPGNPATDFTYVDRQGRLQQLSKQLTQTTILYFTDPACENCMAATKQFAEDGLISRLIADGQLNILLIYTEGDEMVWKQLKQTYPLLWNVGFDSEETIKMKRLYELRAMPSVYLLGADGKVILKDKPAAVIIDFLKEHVRSH